MQDAGVKGNQSVHAKSSKEQNPGRTNAWSKGARTIATTNQHTELHECTHQGEQTLGLAMSPGTCAGTCGFIRGKTHANGSPTYKSPSAYKTREYGCQFWITCNPYGLPVQPVYALVSIRALQQQRGAWAVSKMKWDENQTHDGKFRPDNVNH